MKFLLTVLSVFAIIIFAPAQTLQKAAENAFVVTRMVDKIHVEPKPIDKQFAAGLFKTVINGLDESKIYFTQQDINQLKKWEAQLDVQVLKMQTGFLSDLLNVYTARIKQADTMVDNICSKPFQFNTNEKYAIADDTTFAADDKAKRDKLYKKIKLEILDELVEYDSLELFSPKYAKKLDSIEAAARKKIKSILKRDITKQQNYPGGLIAYIGNEYCNAVATYFDPHTEFFSPVAKERLETELGEKPMQFGFSLNNDEVGTSISRLLPGSPAYKSGQLNKGDKIEALQWEGKEVINVSDASSNEISSILSAGINEKLTITVKKADGSVRQVTLQKEKAVDDDDDKVKSFILKGDKTIGFISFPAFYTDWEDKRNNANGCANDIAKEILKLKKEGIQGLIIDLRFNGGGSVQEAIDLSGLFIDAGPVGQIKTKEEKVITLKDVNRGTVFDGPLLLMVNTYSASASEMVAGTLQDYNRAVILGTPTYGKATAQQVFALDTTINIEDNNEQVKADNYIKITDSKLFRINGTTAQEIGVIPDIDVSPFFAKPTEREANEANVIHSSVIAANKYYKPYAPLPLQELKTYFKAYTDTAQFFVNGKKAVMQYENEKLQPFVTLNLKEAFNNYQREQKKDSLTYKLHNSSFSINNTVYEMQKMKADEVLAENNAIWKKLLSADAFIDLSYRIVEKMIK